MRDGLNFLANNKLVQAISFKMRLLNATSAGSHQRSAPPHGFHINRSTWDCIQAVAKPVHVSLGHVAMRIVRKSKRRIRRMQETLLRQFAQRRSNRTSHRVTPAVGLNLLALEPRVVFDAAGIATADQIADQVAGQQAQAVIDGTIHADWDNSQEQIVALDASAISVTPAYPIEIAFVDSAVEDVKTLLAAIPSHVEVVMIDSSRDGLAQIAAALSGRTEIDAIHILCHGSEGRLNLGSAILDANTMNGAYLGELTAIAKSLSTDADILLYGCDVASGANGQAFVTALSEKTGANVAASIDDTGSSTKSGDWDLETRTGLIEAGLIEAPEWNGLLAPLTISTTAQPTVTGTGAVGTTALWTNAGSVGGTSIDLRATVITFAPGFVGATTPFFGTATDNPFVQLTQQSTVTLRWEIFASGTNQTVTAVGAPSWTIKDIDGIGGVVNTRESAAPSLYNLQSYTSETVSNIVISGSGTTLRASGTQDQTSEPNSAVVFRWSDVSSFDVTYTLWINDPLIQARFEHDGDGDFAFVAPVTTQMLALDLDGNNSTASGTAYQATFTENDTDIPIVDSDVTIAQHAALGTNLGQAHVVLTNAQAGDALSVSALPVGITANIDTSVTGQISVTLSGTASVANYQTALAAIRYANSSDAPSTIDRNITVDVKNTTFSTTSPTALSTIHVAAVNDAPAGADKSITINEDTPYAYSVADFGFTDPNDMSANSLLAVKIATLPASGTLTLAGSAVTSGQFVSATDIAAGKLVYTPPANLSGAALGAFTFQIQDNGGTANSGVDLDASPNSLTMFVTMVNDAPFGADNSITVAEDASHTLTVADFGFSDPYDTPANALKVVEITTLPDSGTLKLNGILVTAGHLVSIADITNGLLVFTPAANANGSPYANFTFQVQDDGGTTTLSDAFVETFGAGTGRTSFAGAGLTGTTTYVYNDGVAFAEPRITDGQYTVISAINTNQGVWWANPSTSLTAATQDFTFKDHTGDPNGRFLEVNAAIGAGEFYRQAVTVTSADTYQVSVALASANSITIKPDVTIKIVDSSGATVATTSTGNLANYTTAANAWHIFALPANLTPGNYQFVLVNNGPGGNGNDLFIDDIKFSRQVASVGADTDPVANTITFNVAPANDPPAATNDFGMGRVGAAVTVDVLANDGDIDNSLVPSSVQISGTANPGDSLVVSGQGTWSVNATTGAITFTPVSGFIGAPTPIAYTVADAVGARSTSVSVAIGPILSSPHLDLSGASPYTAAFLYGHNGTGANPAWVNPVGLATFSTVGAEVGGPGLTLTNDNSSGTVTGVSATTLDQAIVNGEYVSMPFTTLTTMSETWIQNNVLRNAGSSFQYAVMISANGFQSATLLSQNNSSNGGAPFYGSGYPWVPATDFKLEAGLSYELRAYIYDVSGGAAGTATWDDFYTFYSNDPTSYEAMFTEGGSPVAIANATTEIEDANSANIAAGTVTFTNKQTADRLAIAGTVIGNGSTGAIGAIGYTVSEAAGIVTVQLSGTATKAAYSAAIAAITFENTSDTPVTVDRIVTATVTDGIETSNVATTTIHVIPVNDAPVAVNDAYIVDEDSSVSGDLALGNVASGAGTDSDPDGDALTVTQIVIGGATYATDPTVPTVIDIPNVGTLILYGTDGFFSFQPLPNFNGSVPQATYTISDGNGGTDSATLDITVTPGYDAPTVLDSNVYTNEDLAITNRSLDVANIDGGLLIYAEGAVVPAHGTVTISADGTFTYTPAADYNGTDTFSYTVNDGAVTQEHTVTITIWPVNDAPAGADKTVTIDEDASYTFAASDFGFTDPLDNPDHNFKQVVLTTLPTVGTLTYAGGAVSAGQVVAQANIGLIAWTPAAHANGTSVASFTFQVVDDGGTTAAAPNLVVNGSLENTTFGAATTIIPAYDSTTAPTAGDLNPVGLEGWTRVVTQWNDGTNTHYMLDGAKLETDADSVTIDTPFGDQFGFRAHVYQTITELEPGAIYTASGWAIVDSYGVDQFGNPVQTVFGLSVYNDADFDGAIDWSAPSQPSALAQGGLDSYSSGNTPQWREVSFTFTAPTSGSIDLVVQKQAAAAAAACNWDNISVTRMGAGANTDLSPNIFTLNVAPVNDAPVAADDTASVSEDDLIVNGDVTPNSAGQDSDIDNDLLTVTLANQDGNPITIGTPFVTARGGTLTMNNDGSYSFVPGAAYNGLDVGEMETETVQYTINDGNGGTATATLAIAIQGANDTPVVINPFNPGTPANPISATDPLNIIPDVSTNDGASPAPVNVGAYIVDPDGEPLSFTATGLPLGMAIDPATGVITGTLPADASQSGPYTVTVAATDPDGATLETTVTYMVVNVPPLAVDDAATVGEDTTAVSGNVLTDPLTGDADIAPDSDPLTVTSAMQGGNPIIIGTPFVTVGGGSLTLNADGSYTFEPDIAYNGLDVGETATETITYTVSDGNGGSDTATLVITINGANDAPIVIDPLVPGTPDNPAPATDPLNIIPDVTRIDGQPLDPINVATFVVDPDGEPLTFALDPTTPSWVAIDPGTGVMSATPPTDASQATNTGNPGEYLVTITATDPDGVAAMTTVTLNIVNLPPMALDDAASVGEDVVSANGNVITDPTTGDADTAPDSDLLTVTLANQTGTPIIIGTPFVTVGGGTLTMNNDGSYSFVPGAAYNSLDVGETATETITYTVSDGNGGSDTATLVITINGANDTPVVINPFNPGTPANPISATDPLNIIPDVTRIDGQPLDPINVATFVVDPDGEPLTFALDPTTPSWVAIDPGTGVMSATPPTDASQATNTGNPGEYLVTITATDPDGVAAMTTVTLNIVNLNPIAIDDASSISEDAVSVGGNVITDPTTGDADTAPDGDPLTITSAMQGGNPIIIGTPFVTVGGGSLTLNADGSYTFGPGIAYNGLDIGETATETITYTVSDGNGGTDTAMLVISVAGANDAPVADNITLQIEQDEKVTGKVSANDADGNPLVFSGPVSGPSNGLVVVNADGSFHYVPKFGFSGSDVFVVMVDDGNGATTTAVVTIIVNPVPAFVPDVDSRYDSSSLPEQSNVLIIDGIILDAVNTIAPLGSPGVDLRVDGIVFEAVNGVSRLEQASNLHGFPGDWRGPITRMTDLARLADDALTAFPGLRGAWDIQPLTGFSVRMGVQANGPDVDPSERQQIVVDTLVHQRRVFVEISNTVNRSGSERITGYTIQQSDGQPLPVWIRRAESGLLLIETPVDQMSFAIKIVAHRADGTLIERRVEIQLPTGEVRQAEERQNRAPMFNDQLRLQRAN